MNLHVHKCSWKKCIWPLCIRKPLRCWTDFDESLQGIKLIIRNNQSIHHFSSLWRRKLIFEIHEFNRKMIVRGRVARALKRCTTLHESSAASSRQIRALKKPLWSIRNFVVLLTFFLFSHLSPPYNTRHCYSFLVPREGDGSSRPLENVGVGIRGWT